jgi:hypothetical protein
LTGFWWEREITQRRRRRRAARRCFVDSNADDGAGLGLFGRRTVVDVKEFEGAEDGVFFAVGAAARFTVGGQSRALNNTERIAMGLFENLGGDRAMRKFETALGAPQHPTGHVSALGPWSLGQMMCGKKRTRRGRREFVREGFERERETFPGKATGSSRQKVRDQTVFPLCGAMWFALGVRATSRSGSIEKLSMCSGAGNGWNRAKYLAKTAPFETEGCGTQMPSEWESEVNSSDSGEDRYARI